MNAQKVSVLFNHYRCAFKNLRKTCVATSYLHKTTGTRNMAKARKYRRPEHLEDPFYYGIGPKEKVEKMYQSLTDKGLAREVLSYNPPSDVEEQLHMLCKQVFGSQLNSDWKSQSLSDRVMKYKLLTKTMELFVKEVPNSQLHEMKEVNDLHKFFCTPVDGNFNFVLQNKDKLPPNMHILPETPRFDPATDQFFDGITAYPGRKRILYTKAGEKFEKIIEWPHV